MWYDIMSDDMATNLINTIDALIPGTTITTQQPERRANQELRTLMKLSALPARRRRPPGR